MDYEVSPTLTEAIFSQAPLLQAWVVVLMATHYIALVFIPVRTDGGWKVRYEPIAILGSFMAAAALMEYLYGLYGYSRILGLAHLVFWLPAYAWVMSRWREIGPGTIFGKYIAIYLVIAGASLIIDVIDVIRHFTS